MNNLFLNITQTSVVRNFKQQVFIFFHTKYVPTTIQCERYRGTASKIM